MKRLSDVLGFLFVLAGFAIVALAYPALPDPMPSHWNAAGQVNGWLPKFWGSLLLPIITAALWLIFLVLPRISPRGFEMEPFLRAWGVLKVTVLGLNLLLEVLILRAVTHSGELSQTAIFVGLGILFVVIGNLLGKVTRNFFVGIRTPWTLANEEVWYRTHRLAGKLFVVGRPRRGGERLRRRDGLGVAHCDRSRVADIGRLLLRPVQEDRRPAERAAGVLGPGRRSPEELALLARRVRVPSAREVRREPARSFEVALLLEEAQDHRRDLPDLDVLEAQLAMKGPRRILGFVRDQPPPFRSGDRFFLFQGRVEPKRLVERPDRLERPLRVGRRGGREKPAEELVEIPVLPGQAGEELRFHAPNPTEWERCEKSRGF